MRDLNTEHVSMIATWLWPNSNCDPKLAVERAIALVQEAKRQCDVINKRNDELERSQ